MRENLSSEHGEREEEAPTGSPVEGATRAPIMDERIEVFVNDSPVIIYRGMQAKHALISYDYSVYEACEREDVRVEDEHGFRIGLEGALHNGAKIYTKKRD